MTGSGSCPLESGGGSSVPVGQRLPFPAFPLRSSLPAPGPVQAAAPPADYNSDSAESLEEIPVALAQLGSSSTVTGVPLSVRPVLVPPLPCPLPRTKRKPLLSSSRANQSMAELSFEMASTQLPSVFVSRASGDPNQLGEDGLPVGRRQTSSRPGPGSRPVSRTSVSWMER